VTLTIDGLDVFSFSELRKDGRPKYGHFIVPANSSFIITGWFKTNDKADSVERNALIADMAFGAAVTLGVTGAVLLLSSGGSEKAASAPRATMARSEGLHLVPVVGPHIGGAQAVFRF